MLLPCWLLPPLLLTLIGTAPPKPLPGGGGRHPPGTDPCGTWLLTKFGWSEKGDGIYLLPSPVRVKFLERGKLARVEVMISKVIGLALEGRQYRI